MIKALSKRRIAYLHLIEARGSEMGLTDALHEDAIKTMRCCSALCSTDLYFLRLLTRRRVRPWPSSKITRTQLPSADFSLQIQIWSSGSGEIIH